MKKIIALIMSLCLMACVCSCGTSSDDAKDTTTKNTASDLSYVTDNGKLIIGITDYEPMNYKEKGSKVWTGFDTEFAQAVCEKMGINAEFVEINWDNKFLELNSKGIDCIWNGMTISNEVKTNADVSTPYVENAQVVVMTKENAAKYTKAEDMKDLSFVAEKGSAGEQAIKDSKLDGNYTPVSKQTDALLEVKSGAADACVIDITMANSMTGEGTSYADLSSSVKLTSEEYGIAFRKGSDLVEKVNSIITELVADGSLQKLADKYSLTLIAK